MNFPCSRQFSRLAMVIAWKDCFVRANDYFSINVTDYPVTIRNMFIYKIYTYQLPYFTLYELS